MFSLLDRFRPHKNSNIIYYLKNLLRFLYPDALCRIQLESRLKNISHLNLDYLSKRINYYNKLNGSGDQNKIPDAIEIGNLPLPKRQRVYYFDTIEYLRFFNKKLKANFLFGDVTHIPDEPSITKSRPINGDNQNSVVLKLEKMRHFMFIKHDVSFSVKINQLYWRGVVRIPHRIKFMEMYYGNPLCNLGKINTDGGHPEWLRPKASIDEHLKYKFILCIEGNDVATNLKWVMSSNSIAVMSKPKFETWYMEGTLIPDYHYILINDDFSNLEERLTYFISNPEKCESIIRNAHDYIAQFRNEEQESLISLLVLEKYFCETNQLKPISVIAKSNYLP